MASSEPERDKTRRVEHRSHSADWGTPEDIANRVRLIDAIGLDPATSQDNPMGAKTFFTTATDGWKQSWAGYGLVYVNPPYGRVYNRRWAYKIATEGKESEIVALVAARTGSRWFSWMWEADRMCFVTGRLTFVGAEHGAPFDSALCYWGDRAKSFDRAMKDLGTLITP